MSPSQAMIDSAKREPFDDIKTPPGVLRFVLPFVPEHWRIWESAPENFSKSSEGGYGLVRAIAEYDRDVIAIEDNYFQATPDDHGIRWDMQLTNPPFSYKQHWLKRANELKKPWALLLPVTTLGNHWCHPELEDAEIIFLPRRVDFTGKGRPWFSVAWFTKGLKIGKQLTFAVK